MILQAIRVFKELQQKDFEILAAIERWMRRYEFVPVNKLPALSRFTAKDVDYVLRKVNKFRLISRQTVGYVGYKLTPAGHDVLALQKLVAQNILQAFGTPLGIGKEADIYDALMPNGEKVAVKFNRLGRTSFTRVGRLRQYTPKHGWMQASISATEREFKALEKLYPKVSVPRPIATDRHVIVMGLIDGVELATVKDVSDPKAVLDSVLENIKRSYKLGVVHADLSEHNILIKPSGDVLIIDWPQWVPTDHPNSPELLERDIFNLLKYFRRKFGLKEDLSKILELIKN
jgi:RIO kinase 2